MGCGCGKRFSNTSTARTAARAPAPTANVSGRQIVENQAKVVRSQNFAQPATGATATPMATATRRTV